MNKVLKRLQKLYRKLRGNWWIVRRTTWPYDEGYCTYNKLKRTILDTGIKTPEAAQAICDELNNLELLPRA